MHKIHSHGEESKLPMQGVLQPSWEDVLHLPRVHLSQHPVLAHKMTLLRDRSTPPALFARLLQEIGILLAYEATATLPLERSLIETPLQEMKGARLVGKIGLLPILRAGLGLAEGFRLVLPDAQVWHLGLRRNEQTLNPEEYYNSLPASTQLQICYALDPMLATGGSAIDAITLLKQRGTITRLAFVCAIAAPYGLQRLSLAHPDIDIYVAALDDALNDRGYIVPGLGDAGDRQFGTF